MKIALSVLAMVALVAVVLLLSNRSNDGQGDGQGAVQETAPAQSEPETSMLDRPDPGEQSRERPQLPRPRTLARKGEQSVPVQPVQPVQIDRLPFDPAKESDSQYERRVQLATAFDRFREESGISDEKAQAVLALLYDWQETSRHVRKQHLDRTYRDEWEADYKQRETSHTWRLVLMDTRDALEEMLTPEEMGAWYRIMEPASVFGLLHWPYEPPLIVPADT